MKFVCALLGALLVLRTFTEFFETMVLPRSDSRAASP
jgi:hypothetical protein